MSYYKAQAFWETSCGLGRQIREKEGITRNEKWAKQELTKEEAVDVSVGQCAKICLGDGGGNYGWPASSRTLDSWCADGVCTGKLRAVGEQRNKCFVVCTGVSERDFMTTLAVGVS